MQLEAEVKLPKIHNRYDIKVIDSITQEVVQEAHGENVVLNQFYNHIARNASMRDAINQICYGDGTGTISAARTSMFAQKGAAGCTKSKVTTADLLTFTGKITLSESTYVGGIISEVGAISRTTFRDTYMLCSHALLEDSEGNPITIGPKTNTQIIELYVTAYVERTAGMKAFPNSFSEMFAPSNDNGDKYLYSPTIRPAGVGLSFGTWNAETKVLTSTVKRIAANEANTHPVFTHVELNNLVARALEFPNATAFPTYSFPERQIGAGDGVKRFFSIPTDIFKPGTEVIKVDGVTKIRDTDYKVSMGGPRTEISPSAANYPYGIGLTPNVYSTDASKGNPVALGAMTSPAFPGDTYANENKLVDLQKVVSIQEMVLGKSSTNSGYQFAIFLSEDGSTWENTADYITNQGLTSETIILPSPKMARYIWIGRHIGYGYPTSLTVYGGPNIVFSSPPANGSIIRAAWDCEYPPKHSLLFYDVQIAIAASW